MWVTPHMRTLVVVRTKRQSATRNDQDGLLPCPPRVASSDRHADEMADREGDRHGQSATHGHPQDWA